MRKLLVLLAALLGGALWPSSTFGQAVTGPSMQILCNKQALANVATATTTSLINGVAGQIIAICGWHVTSSQSASSTFQLIQGTQGGPCGTPSNVTAQFNVTSTAPSADHIDYATITLPAGAQVCVVSTGSTVALGVLVYYSQF